ncbi:hypothetical protein B296_00020740 [Ensete ventricosum]|uniref:Uncharacterized protein n=1 Tax=Ensete ventricosum TaxID=4639 RepID=A0A427B188_ENSVE|nr:hypothetical protein B296_00020740 [Ensete ventricosum]
MSPIKQMMWERDAKEVTHTYIVTLQYELVQRSMWLALDAGEVIAVISKFEAFVQVLSMVVGFDGLKFKAFDRPWWGLDVDDTLNLKPLQKEAAVGS